MSQNNDLNITPGGFKLRSAEESSTPLLNESTFNAGRSILQPPTVPIENQFDPKTINRADTTLVSIKEDEVREALNEYVAQNCCYGSKAAEELEITDIVMRRSFRYKLETFTEKRATEWKFEPYDGQPVDSPNNGRTPGAWEVLVPPKIAFEKGSKRLEVPHSAFVRICDKCTGNGRSRCDGCSGHGTQSCLWCAGSGKRLDERCTHCSGLGTDRCSKCNGSGQVNCKTCNGTGKTKCFMELTVYWTNHADDFVSDETGLPEKLIKKAKGNVVVDERFPRLYPLFNFPDEKISSASKRLIDKHVTSFPMEQILEQRHKVVAIPVALVYYRWREKEGLFYVYGFEQKVCFDDYPQRCCCGVCQIL